MIIIKALILQSFWYLSVAYGHAYQFIVLTVAILLSILNFYIYKPSVTKGHYFFTLALFIFYGIFQEALFEGLSLVNYGHESVPFWLTALYVVFIGYYGDLLNYLSSKPVFLLSVIGAIGGVISYYGGAQISPIVVLSPFYYLAVALGWAIFFPLSIKVFYEGLIWNKLLDTSLYYSFDRSGFIRHQKTFTDHYSFKSGSNALITGGTSGIGKAASLELSNQGTDVTITGRSKLRGELLASEHENIRFTQWDMSNWNEIPSVVSKLNPLDYVVLNAGGMPDKFITNEQGIELQFASQLFGHYYLIKELKDKKKLKDGAKIVWVTSGGLYLSKLKLEFIFKSDPYDKVASYANVKRAQVTLLDFFKEEFPKQVVTAMHPGWAETPGVESAIPEFNKKMKGRLRSPIQAADTILWLLGTKKEVISGKLYFDRKVVKTNFFWFTQPSNEETKKLIELLKSKKP